MSSTCPTPPRLLEAHTTTDHSGYHDAVALTLPTSGLLLAGGVPVEVISKRLGHSRISTTMDLYVLSRVVRQTGEAADAFGRLIAGEAGTS